MDGWLSGRALAPLAAICAAACGGADLDAYCEERESCVDGNDADREACVISLEAASDAAGAQGCAEEFDEYYVCLGEESSCEEGQKGDCAGDECPGGGAEDVYVADEDACKAERRAYRHCADFEID